MSDHLEQPVWDGNGGTLDPKTASDHDLMVAMHVKMDQIVIPQLRQLTKAQAAQERGDFTRAQTMAIRQVNLDERDANLSRRSMKAPIFAVVVALAALITSAILTLAVGGVIS